MEVTHSSFFPFLMATHKNLIFFLVAVFFRSGAATIDASRNACRDVHLIQEKGVINSPNYPHSYPNSTNCTWTILSPPYSVLTLVFKDIDIEDDTNCRTPPCCHHNVLTLKMNENGLTQEICGRNRTKKPVHLSQLQTKIKFYASSSNRQPRGFSISFFIEVFHGGFCPSDQMRCSRNSDHCFTTSIERCDGVFHCPNGEDEVGCDIGEITEEPDDMKIPYGDDCVHQSLWCEGNYACDSSSDQDACLKNSVVSATIMGCLFCGLMLVIAMMCGLRLYTNNENGRNYRIQIPAHIASRLSLTRYISLPELMDDEFFHREPPPSYSIAVGQSNNPLEGLSSYSGRRGRSWRQRSHTPVKPPTPPPSTDTSNQSSPSRDSITSSSYLSNDENIRLVNTENE